MANTNFAALTNEQKTFWSMDFWRQARNNSFIMQFAGQGPNAMIQQINELSASEKGTRAVLTLVADIEGDGTVGDHTLEGNEEAIKAYDTVIRIDQMRQANRLAGRMADQKSIVNFRETSRDVLSYWFSDRIDQIAFLTLSGLPLSLRCNGAARPAMPTGQNFTDLEWASDWKMPSTYRHLVSLNSSSTPGKISTRVDPAGGSDRNLSNVAGDCGLTYKTIVNLKAYAKNHYLRGLRGGGNEEMYHMFVTPDIMAQLKLDEDFLKNVRHGGIRGESNILFSGNESLMIDGVMIHEFRHVFNTSMAAASAKMGSYDSNGIPNGTVDGTRVLFCGAQAMGMADLGNADYIEEVFDYENQYAISVSKILGFLKPQFFPTPFSNATSTTVRQDFGVIALDVASPV